MTDIPAVICAANREVRARRWRLRCAQALNAITLGLTIALMGAALALAVWERIMP